MSTVVKIYLPALALMLFVVSCTQPTDIAVNFDEQFSLSVGQEGVLPDGNSVRFMLVESDSRCPAEAPCFWETEQAVVLIELLEQGVPPLPTRLSTHRALGSSFTREVEIQGYTIFLVDVTPYPQVGSKIDPNDYVVELRVSR